MYLSLFLMLLGAMDADDDGCGVIQGTGTGG
jgi:hypothetical protein